MSQELTLFLIIVAGVIVGLTGYSLFAVFIPGTITS
jgi:hypothetical protein